MSVAAQRLDLQKEPPDDERVDRVLTKLGRVWRQLPDWRLAWLIVNIVPTGPKASDAEIEHQLDNLLKLTLE